MFTKQFFIYLFFFAQHAGLLPTTKHHKKKTCQTDCLNKQNVNSEIIIIFFYL